MNLLASLINYVRYKFYKRKSGKSKEACENKNVKVDVDRVLDLDKEKREN